MSFIRLDGSFSNHLAVTLEEPHIFTPINMASMSVEGVEGKKG